MTRDSTRASRTPLRLGLLYFALGVTWIVVTDFVLARLRGTPSDVMAIEIAKGSAFVAASALFLYFVTRRALEQRERAIHRLETLIEAAPLGIIAFDAQRRPIRWNEAALRISSRIDESGDPRRAIARFESRLVPEWEDGKGHDVRLDGQDREPVDLRVFFVRMRHDGKTTGWMMLMRDRSAETALEAQLLQAQKMEAIGRLAGGVAHDFNNVLTAIVGHADLLVERLPQDSTFRDDVDEIRKAAARATALTRRLLFVSRKRLVELKPINVNVVVKDMDGMLRRVIGEDIECLTELEPEPLDILADAGQIEQVLLNLAVNARDAMPAGGTLLIETANTVLDESFAAAHTGLRPGRYVLLATSDTGSGMDATTRARAFEPFFTTKENGSGLGLATVYGIVKQHAGYISLYSEPNRGTTFKVYFPAHAGTRPARPRPERVTAGPLPEAACTVLLADDDPAVRAIVMRTLREGGHRVLEAATGAEALRLLERETQGIDLLLTDVVMPDITGPELARQVLATVPEARVLFMSGYTAGVLEKYEPGSTPNFLEKPFGPDSLRRKVAEVLSS
jgi:signal transduction histidine kinase